MYDQKDDLLVKHAAHLLTLQGLTQWFYPVFENVFGREDKVSYHSYVPYLCHSAALEWLNIRSKHKISEEEWHTVVLNNSDVWLDSGAEGFGLDFMLSRNVTWEYKFKQLIYESEGLTVIAGLRTNPMVPHYEDWGKVFPEWSPYPVHVFPAGFIPGDFGGRNYEWIVMIVPAVFQNVIKIMLALEPSSHTHPVEGMDIVEVLEVFNNDNDLLTEIALTVPQTFTSEEAVLTSITLEAIVSKRLKRFLSDT